MSTNPFDNLPRTPAAHFKLYFYSAVLYLIEQVSRSFGSYEKALEQFPFLVGYNNELAEHGLEGLARDAAALWWRDTLYAWEETATGHLPLRALRKAADLDHATLTLLLCIGIIEEDLRFGPLFEAIQGIPGQHRPTLGTLNSWRQESVDDEIRPKIRQLQELGLIQVVNPEAPRLQWALQIHGLLWDAIRGDNHEVLTPWAHYYPPTRLLSFEELILPEILRESLAMVPDLLISGDVRTLIVRGPQQNGRGTLLGAVARALGRGILKIQGLNKGDEHWRLIGSLATLLNAMPAIVLDLAPGEKGDLPQLNGFNGPLGVVLSRQGGVSGPGAGSTLTLTLEIPDVHARRLHWERGFDTHQVSDLDKMSERFRMTSGNIHRTASMAQSHAKLNGQTIVTLADIQQASRTLNRQSLDTLAMRVNAIGDWSHLAVGMQTLTDLYNLESRCRHREQLHTSVGPALGAQLKPGVRALFSGPSGTGKSLAAYILASVLQMDLYRLDLSAVVNKYIGETEKNLNQIFARAEELDVILLLDEGDALLTQRTAVQTSNDRYANLETNYLLQRIESFEGILIVTTNASDRIDNSFQRRMDVVIEFRPPEAEERWAIWQLHLPSAHAVDLSLLGEVSKRCTLTGGQIRNAVLHAALLALNDGGIITSSHLDTAVQQEYRKLGAVCPLRHTPTVYLNRG